MPVLHISEHSSSGGPAVSMPPLKTQTVPIGQKSQKSKPFGGDTHVIVVYSDVACAITIDKDPTASPESVPLAAGRERQFNIKPEDSLAVIETDAPAGDSMAGFFAVLADPKAAQKRQAKIAADQAVLDASIAENRALAEQAVRDRAAADLALAEAHHLTDGFEATCVARTAQLDQRDTQLSTRQTAVENGEQALAADVRQRTAALTELEAAAAAREAETAALLEQARNDAADAAVAKAKWEGRRANAEKLLAEAD